MLPPEPLARAQDLAIVLLELCVGLASFTGCMVAVDKLFLFYSTIFYKAMAFLSPDRYEPTRRYPSALKRNAKHPRVLVQLPMFNETHVAARIIEYACRMEYPRDRFEVQVRFWRPRIVVGSSHPLQQHREPSAAAAPLSLG